MLIGIHGRAGSGKDQSYQFVKEWADGIGHYCRRDAFADRLKLSAARALGFEGDLEEAVAFCNNLKGGFLLYGPSRSSMEIVTGRKYLQYYGTEAHREIFGNDFWIKAVMETYDPASSGILMVTDVRFENEAKVIRDLGGQIWHIVRPQNSDAEDPHASEQTLPSRLIDQTIVNDRGLDSLRDLVLSRIERLVYT